MSGSYDHDYYSYLDPEVDMDYGLDPSHERYTYESAYDIPVPEQQEWYQPGIFDISMPIHPEYKKWLNPQISIGDLVETDRGDVGIVVSITKPEGIAFRIKEANNNTYTVLIGDEEKLYIGYSLKIMKKQLDK